MIKPLLICTMLTAAMTVQAAAPDIAPTAMALQGPEYISVSTGHNLKTTYAPLAKKVKGLQALPDSNAVTTSRHSGIRPYKANKAPKATADQPTSLLAESFESCTLLSDELPQGWTRISDLTGADATHHWHGISKAYASQWYFPQPADGDMMMVMFYDDYYKDEMIISPEIGIPADGGYQLSYSWFTTPVWLYMIDRFHIDFETGEFIVKEEAFNFEIQVKADGGQWETLYSLIDQYADMEYGELSTIELPGLVRNTISLDKYAGKNIQIGFRYYGIEGDALFIDDVRVDLPAPSAYYTPSLSRLFYGISPDTDMYWMPASIEFVPVNYPVRWYNASTNDGEVEYTWTYYDIDDNSRLTAQTCADPDVLSVTYRPDYFSSGTLMNNLYYMPLLNARGSNGAVGTYKSKSEYLQAGGTTEFTYADNDAESYTKYTAFSFDVLNEGLGIHVEECEELGLFAEPIFGYSANHDTWWEHYSYPDGNPEGRYSYVDGFANLIIPHEEAPMAVFGVSAMAQGTITADALFRCTVYRVDDEGQIIETPMAQTAIRGEDVLTVYSGLTRDFLVLNFRFDSPLIFSAEDTGLGYIVEISGYHDPKNVEYFAPLQSMVPNEYEWCLGYYRHHWPYDTSVTEEMSMVAFFTNDYGDDLYTSFAIGIDAHYPWLEVDGSPDITIDGTEASAVLRGYYPADMYTVQAPEWLSVTLSGNYLTDVRLTVLDTADTDRTAEVIISAPGVTERLNVTAKSSSGIIDIANDARRHDNNVYTPLGIVVKQAADTDELKLLPAGIYIYKGEKIIISK